MVDIFSLLLHNIVLDDIDRTESSDESEGLDGLCHCGTHGTTNKRGRARICCFLFAKAKRANSAFIPSAPARRARGARKTSRKRAWSVVQMPF